MKSEDIVVTILVINSLIALAVYIWGMIKKERILGFFRFIIILLSPLIGIAFLVCSHLLKYLLFNNKELTYQDIGFDTTRHIKKQKSNFQEEVDILPLEEAFMISKTDDRRRAFLTTLKRDYGKNMPTILMGLENEDSETSHYAASVVLTTNGDYLSTLINLEKSLKNSKEKLEPAKKYLACLKEYISSNIPSDVDKKKYLNAYMDTFDFICDSFEDSITIEEFIFIIETLTEIGDLESAAKWSERACRYFPENDSVYLCMMKLYYQKKDFPQFFDMLREIMDSDMNISNEMIETIRFFNQ